MRPNTLLVGLVIALAGCSKPADDSTASAPAAAANSVKVVVKDASIARIRGGEAFEVVLDSCPEDDAGWKGAGDFLGALKCGETYKVKFDAASAKFEASGLNEEGNSQVTASDGSLSSQSDAISIWGAPLLVGDNEVITTPQGVAVGHIKFAS